MRVRYTSLQGQQEIQTDILKISNWRMLVVLVKWRHHASPIHTHTGTHFSWTILCKWGKGVMRLTLCDALTCETRRDHCTGNSVPYSLWQVRGVFNFLVADYITLKMQGTGPMIYRPYPRRLEHLTICRCHCKGSMFSSVILRPWVLVQSSTQIWDQTALYQLS